MLQNYVGAIDRLNSICASSQAKPFKIDLLDSVNTARNLLLELDLDTVAYVNFSEAYNLRVSEAVVEEKESVMSKIDVADFYAKYTQLQQNAMASMAQG